MFNLLISLNWKYTNNKSQTKNYSQTRKTLNTKKIFGLLLCCKKKANQACKKTELQPRTLILVCGFVASSHVLIFAVIGHNIINIPEIF